MLQHSNKDTATSVIFNYYCKQISEDSPTSVMSFKFHGNKGMKGVLMSPLAIFANKTCITIKFAAAQSICIKIMLQNSSKNYVMELRAVCIRYHNLNSDDLVMTSAYADIKASIPVGSYHIAIVASPYYHMVLPGGTIAYVQIQEIRVTDGGCNGKHFLFISYMIYNI